ncbi:hypothetical protein BDZ89DRAFT_1209749 [Hymenopellis radicata]|nr:hypothetical protein BDZ89DRAFT_1209749 [Hymenopellis radicata]
MSKLDTAAKWQLSYQLFYLAVLFRVVYLIDCVPWPRLAAITDFYQGYYTLWKSGRFVRQVEELHRFCVGPVVRVPPNEASLQYSSGVLHLTPDSSGDPFFDNRFPWKPVIVQDKVNLFMDQVHQHNGEPIDFFRGFQSPAMDVVSAYCFAHSVGCLTLDIPSYVQYKPQKPPSSVFCTASQCYAQSRHGGSQIKNVVKAQGEVPSRKALIEEAMVLLAAGTDTTSNAMEHAGHIRSTSPSSNYDSASNRSPLPGKSPLRLLEATKSLRANSRSTQKKEPRSEHHQA